MGINSLEIIKHPESLELRAAAACVNVEGSRVRAYAITMDFKMFSMGSIKGPLPSPAQQFICSDACLIIISTFAEAKESRSHAIGD